MNKRTLPRLAGSGWTHPYTTGPFGPFLYADGGDSGSGSDDDTGGTGDGGDQGDSSGDGDDNKPGDKPQPSQRGKPDDTAARIAQLEKDLTAARKEAAKDRTTAKQQAAQDAEKALATKVAKALGLVEDDDDGEPDPTKLLEQLKEKETATTAAQAEAIAARVEATVVRTAYAMGVDGDKLLDSRKFCDEVDDLDAEDPKKFKAALKAAIKEAADKNPALRTGQQSKRSGGDLPGGPPEGNRQQRPTSLSAAVRGAFNT